MSVFGLGRSEAPALLDATTGETITYEGLSRRSADLLRRIDRRSLVFIVCRNDLFTATTYVALLEGGHAVALLDGSRPAGADANLIAHYRAGWVAGPEGHADALTESGLPVDRVIALDGGELIRLRPPDPPDLHPDLSLLLLTSGTTGSRRLVRLTAENVRVNARDIATVLELDERERPITSLPLHYTFGLSILNSHLMVGATIVLSTESVVQRSFWEAVETAGCTSLAGVPYTFQMLERIGYRDRDLPTVRTMQQAGGALDRRLTRLYAEHMAAKGGRLYVMYGQTEATARMAWVPPGDLLDRLGSAGKAIPSGRFRIEGSEPGPPGRQTGEVIFEGPNVMQGYADGPADLTTGDVLGGVLRTGDIGYLDDGYLYLVGRSKRIAKVYGVRINLDEVERMLGDEGPVAVVGGDDVIWGFCAFGSEIGLEGLARDLAKRLRINVRAVRLRRVDRIPTSGTGKIDYRAVERWILS